MAARAAGGPAAAATGGSGAAAAGRQIEAFDAEPMLEEKRVLCVEAWSQYALLGLSDGSLLLASQPAPAASSASGSDAADRSSKAGGEGNAGQQQQQQQTQAQAQAQPKEQQGQPLAKQQQQGRPWAMAQSLRNFGQGRVRQLVVARERSMLLCLADDGVNAYVLPAMRLKGQAGRTKGASLFAWHAGTDTLAVAVKRRVLLFKYDGLEFVEQREVSLPDPPASMALAGATLYVGTNKRDYMAVEVASGALRELFASKGPAACAVAVSPSEVLLAKDGSAVLYGADGRPAKRGSSGGGGSSSGGGGGLSVAWSAPPLGLAASGPYALAVMEGAVEARLLEPLNAADLWQRLAVPLPVAASSCLVAPSVAPDGSLYVANKDTGAVLQLRPVSFVRQAEQLLGLGVHEEALAMAALAPAEAAAERKELEDRIHLAFGQELFRLGKFEEALLHFGMSALAGPLQLLRLFPSLAPPKLLAAAEAEHAGREGAGAADQQQQQQQQQRGGAGQEAAGGGAPEDGGPAAAAEPQGEAFVGAVQVLMPYLLSHRSRLAAAAASPSPKGRPTAELPAAAAGELQAGRGEAQGSASLQQQQQQQQRTPKTPLPAAAAALAAVEASPERPGPSPATRAAIVQQRLEGSATAALLDSALLLALLALPDSGALLRFVQRPNCVDLEAGEAALQAAGRFSELVALYHTKGRHAAALELLHKLSQCPDQLPAPAQGASAELRGLPGVWAAVKYVCHMPEGERDLSLISIHARWMLAADPDAGLEMFGSMQPPLPPSAALPMLTSYAPHLAGPYLEAALASGAADPAEYEQELARIYLEAVVGTSSTSSSATAADGTSGKGGKSAAPAGANGSAPAAGQGQAEGAAESLPEYGKLRQLILASHHLDYEALLRVVPQQRLLEVRAALLERLGRHTEALRIFVHRLHQLPLAEAYCDRVYQRRQLALREARHAELAAALRRQRAAAASAAAAGAAGALPAAAGMLPAAPDAGSSSGSLGSARSLQFGGGGAGVASAPAIKLQPARSREMGTSEDGADIYLLLVQVLLEARDASGAFHPVQRAPDHAVWGEVACLLSRKRDAIQPLHALGLLPGEVPLSSALPFLEGALWGTGERRRAASVARSLRRSEHVGLLGQLADVRQRSILLTPERNCSICFKRVGTAALVAFPSGLLAHYSCYRRTSGQGQQQQGQAGGTAAAANGGRALQEWR